MFKFATLAALLGCASSASVMGWSDGDVILDNKWLHLNWESSWEVEWGTLYRGEGPETTVDAEVEEYGLFSGATYSFSLSGDWGKFRQFGWELSFVPYYIEPYVQRVEFYRPEEPLFALSKVTTKGYRDIHMVELTTTRSKNLKTYIKSLVDWYNDQDNYELKAVFDDYVWNDDNEGSFDDPYYSWKIFEELDETITTKSFYGLKNWYDEIVVYERA